VLVLTPGVPLGLLTNAVQTLAGVLLPSATVFLLLLCNDKAVLGPWVNGRGLNLFTGAVIAILIVLSIILTASVLFPDIGEASILAILGGGAMLALAVAASYAFAWRDDGAPRLDWIGRASWRMPPLDRLASPRLTASSRAWLVILRLYLVLAGGLVLLRIVALAAGAA
jgi:hypothetical protein